MKNLNILKELFSYTKDELFYKNYYEAEKNGYLSDFLNHYTNEELTERKLIIPSMKDGWYPVAMDDDLLFLGDHETDIILTKHNRYTPVFDHKHTFFEMIYVINGQCTQCINDQKIILKEGTLCIVAPLTTHSIGVFDDSIVMNIIIRRKTFENVFYTLLQSSNKITDFVNRSLYLYQEAGCLLLDTKKDEQILELVLNLYNEYIERKPHFDLVLNSELMYMLSLVLQRYEDTIEMPQKPFNGNKTMIDIISYIEDHFHDITLAKVADHFTYSQGYLSRMIKKETGQSFRDLLFNIKFDKARGLLETTDQSIEDIAYAVGFENSENFYRLFKKKFHITPGKYRKSAQN
jgi:YesN/AraC family two-component response regulator